MHVQNHRTHFVCTLACTKNLWLSDFCCFWARPQYFECTFADPNYMLARGCGLGKVFGYLWNTFRFNIQSCSHSRRHNHGHSHCCRKHVCWEFETPLNLRENTNVLSARQITPHIIITFCFMSLLCLSTKHLDCLFRLIQHICWDPLPTRDITEIFAWLEYLLDPLLAQKLFSDHWPIQNIYYDPLLIQIWHKTLSRPIKPKQYQSLGTWAKTHKANCFFAIANFTWPRALSFDDALCAET